MKTTGIVQMKKVVMFCLILTLLLLAVSIWAAPPLVQQRPRTDTNMLDDKDPVVLPKRQTDMVIVPKVVGMVYKNAIPVIQKAGFYATSNEKLSRAKNMTVVSQSPAAGTVAKKKTFVTMNVR